MNLLKNKIQYVNLKKGYTLLFAVIVSVLVLSIAAFILSVSRKEEILASSARDSIYAFYAADSGLECAVENLDKLATSSNNISFTCGNNSITANQDPLGSVLSDPNTIAAGTSTFSMPNNDAFNIANQYQSGISSCASTTVTYVSIPADYAGNGLATSTTITVTVRGYNIGWDSSLKDCSVTGPRKVERALQYTQYQ